MLFETYGFERLALNMPFICSIVMLAMVVKNDSSYYLSNYGKNLAKVMVSGENVVTDSRIRSEPAIQNLLGRMPSKVSETFSDEQLLSLKVAIGSRSWGKHKIDFRGTFPIPFVSAKIYFVFLMGRNYRNITRREQLISAFTLALFVTLLIIFSVLMGILVLYLLKSALGIDLIDGFSFGIWDWFKGLWK
jgi:hypothetical protein